MTVCEPMVDVSYRFEAFFVAMFVISLCSCVSVLVSCRGLKDNENCFRTLGSLCHGLSNCLYLIALIFGSISRWSKTGRVCSGDYRETDIQGNYKQYPSARW